MQDIRIQTTDTEKKILIALQNTYNDQYKLQMTEDYLQQDDIKKIIGISKSRVSSILNENKKGLFTCNKGGNWGLSQKGNAVLRTIIPAHKMAQDHFDSILEWKQILKKNKTLSHADINSFFQTFSPALMTASADKIPFKIKIELNPNFVSNKKFLGCFMDKKIAEYFLELKKKKK